MEGVALFLYRLAMAVFPCMPPPTTAACRHSALGDTDERDTAELNADLLANAPTPSQANTPTPYSFPYNTRESEACSGQSSPDVQVVPLARFQELERELEKQREVARVFREAWQKLQDDVNRMSEATPTPSPMPFRPSMATPVSASPMVASHALQSSICSPSVESAGETQDTASLVFATPGDDGVQATTPRALPVLSPLTPVLVEEEEKEESTRSSSPSAQWVSSTVDKPAPLADRSALRDVTPQSSRTPNWSHMEHQLLLANTTPPASVFLDADENVAPPIAGVPNTVTKYQESKHVRVHNTPFPVRVDRALQVEQARRELSQPNGAHHQ